MINSKKITIISISIIIALPILLIPQGLDFTDTGWMLTYFQNIFTNPESITFWFHLYLTHLIGGIWELIFGQFGLIGYKVAGVLIFWITSLTVYHIFKDFINKNYILIGIVLGIIYNFTGKITIIHYNNLSLLFSALTILFIKKGMINNYKFLFIAGITVAFNSFVRLPNILTASLILGVIYFDPKKGIRNLLVAILGFISAIACILIIMNFLGHTEFYFNSIYELFNSSTDIDSNYGLEDMLFRFIRHYYRATKTSIFFLMGVIPFAWLLAKIKNKGVNILLITLFAIGSIFSYILVLKDQQSHLLYLMIGITFLSFYFILFSKKVDKEVKLLTILVFLTISSLSIGSDTGMKVGSYVLLIAFPLILWFCKSKKILFLTIIFFIITGFASLNNQCYRDNSNRLKMTTNINSKLLKGIKTTKKRATSVEELLEKLEQIDIQNNTLLCLETIGMVHYLTKTEPYIYNPWPMLESKSQLKKLLKERENDFLPIIILAKQQTRSQFWPNNEPLSQWKHDKINRNIYLQFIKDNNYKQIWSNGMFSILSAD